MLTDILLKGKILEYLLYEFVLLKELVADV